MLKMHFARKFDCKYFAIKNISIIFAIPKYNDKQIKP